MTSFIISQVPCAREEQAGDDREARVLSEEVGGEMPEACNEGLTRRQRQADRTDLNYGAWLVDWIWGRLQWGSG